MEAYKTVMERSVYVQGLLTKMFWGCSCQDPQMIEVWAQKECSLQSNFVFCMWASPRWRESFDGGRATCKDGPELFHWSEPFRNPCSAASTPPVPFLPSSLTTSLCLPVSGLKEWGAWRCRGISKVRPRLWYMNQTHWISPSIPFPPPQKWAFPTASLG